MATCPECDAEIEVDPDDLEELQPGDPWDCEACGSGLRVLTLAPLEFDIDEDDDDDELGDDEKKEGDAAEDVDDLDDDADADETEDWEE